ncbi:DUF2357 domain-containing protein [Dyella sp.]|jgi:hypothetical protein|uniref:DUF2357 domain-containing protein n=1 Tax=Dyella sp. TaxID=1869338 RepID=UPI002D77FE36|nr:DUF2357 domain-containing protein [Dyella sp.]HET6432553.1 DUF2357 domain-containing protein [Dyella sp.]
MLRCLDNNGEPIEISDSKLCAGFTERGRYYFLGAPSDAQLFIDDEALRPTLHEGETAFLWEPGFFAGNVVAELADGSGNVASTFLLDVSPSQHKLGRVQFDQMIDELFSFDPQLVAGTEAAQTSVGAMGDARNPHLEYARLRRYGPEFLASLQVVAAKPLTRLCSERALRKPNQAKRVDPHTIRSALTSPGALALMRGTAASEAIDGSTLLNVPIAYDGLDNPANRTMSAVRQTVIRRVRLVSEALRLAVEKEQESQTRTALAPRVERRLLFLKSLDRSLRRLDKINPFASTSRCEISAAGLNAVSAHPAYARAFRLAWRVLRAGLAGDNRSDNLWISPSWEIYERWCFVKVIQIVEKLLPDISWHPVYSRSGGEDQLDYKGNLGNVAVQVLLQPKFPAWDQPSFQGFQSISGLRIPDIVVTLKSPERSAFLVLDAKYRTSRQGVLDGMQSAHLYSDSLRWNGLRPQLSLLLIPRSGGAEWLEARSFLTEHGVGVAPLGVAQDDGELAEILENFFSAGS